MNLSFAGCGFLGIYHVGVAVCFKKYAPHLLLNNISGASAGAIAACCLLCDMPIGDEVKEHGKLLERRSDMRVIDEITTDMLNLIREARARTLGPFSPSFNVQDVLLEGLKKVLPEDAHLRVNGKLHISLTRVCDGKNVIVTHFNSKEDLLEALLASAFVPIFSGLIPPKFHGVRYIDGGFSNNLPTLDENTITVSPFCGETDICPRDFSSQLFHVNVANTSIELSKQNIHRFARILWPPKAEVLSNLCKQGFDDALRFLHRNNLISCTRCLAVQSTFVVSEALDESFEYDPQCQECKQHRQDALVANLPDKILSLFQEAIDTANKGIINWLFKHRGMTILSIATLPYTLPFDMVYAVLRKIFQLVPHMIENLLQMCKFVADQLSRMLCDISQQHKQQQVSAKVSCQLAVTNYGTGASEVAVPAVPAAAPAAPAPPVESKGKLVSDIEATAVVSSHDKMHHDMPIHMKNKNYNFTINLEDSDLDKSGKITNKILSRRSSFHQHQHQQQLQQLQQLQEQQLLVNNNTESSLHPIADDTFENILRVTEHHDAVMAFYYMDDDNKMKMTEIFDVTEEEANIMLGNSDAQIQELWSNNRAQQESKENKVLDGYDTDHSLSDQSDVPESAMIFSDPESEWSIEEKQKKKNQTSENSNRPIDSRPESDRTQSLQ